MKQKNYDELELKDDFIFGKVMSNPEICKRTLEVLLDKKIEKITYPERQKSIDVTIEGKSIRLDVYVQDETATVYNAEMQQSDGSKIKKELPKRSRYYQGMIDLNLLEKGEDYKELQESYIIFICTFDPFGHNKSKYVFQTICCDNPKLVLPDMTTKVFLNTKGDRRELSAELKQLLDYIETKQTGDAFTKQLHREVESVKRNEEWRREYMKEFLIRNEIREEGYAEGKADGKAEGETLFAKLSEVLMQDAKLEELQRAIKDIDYRELLYREYKIKV